MAPQLARLRLTTTCRAGASERLKVRVPRPSEARSQPFRSTRSSNLDEPSDDRCNRACWSSSIAPRRPRRLRTVRRRRSKGGGMALPTLNGWMRWYLADLQVIGSDPGRRSPTPELYRPSFDVEFLSFARERREAESERAHAVSRSDSAASESAAMFRSAQALWRREPLAESRI